MEAGIPSSADYLCTSSRDSFHCNGAKSREANGAKPTEKCFYLARLSSLLKVRFFWESHAATGRNRGEPTPWFEKKRLWSLNDDTHTHIYPPLSLIFLISVFRDHTPASSSAFRSNDSRDPQGSSQQTGEEKRGKESGRNCVNYSLISASDPWITSRRGYWSLSRLLSDVFEMAWLDTGVCGGEKLPLTREKRASVARDKRQRVIYEIGCFNKPPGGATKHRALEKHERLFVMGR